MNDTVQPVPAVPEPQLRSQPCKVSTGRALSWLIEGSAFMLKKPLVLIGTSLIWHIALVLSITIPIIGTLILFLFWPVLSAGYFLALNNIRQQQPISFGLMFSAFKDPLKLIKLGCIYIAIFFSIIFILFILVLITYEWILNLLSNSWLANPAVLFAATVLLLVIVAFAVSIAMAFSPTLIYKHQLPISKAIKLNITSIRRNISSFTILWISLITIFIALNVIIPFGGLLFLPLSYGALFCAYSDILLDSSSREL